MRKRTTTDGGELAGFIRRPAVRLAMSLALCFGAVGCAPSTAKVIEMRRTGWAWKARSNQELLVRCIQGDDAPSDPCKHLKKAAWRIEALRTAHHLDKKFDFAAAEPELHRKTRALTKQEYENPRSSSRQDRVRAWAVHLLGEAKPPESVAYFVEVLIESTPRRDPEYRVCLAAFSALYPRMEALAANPLLRRKMLYRVAQISSELDKGRVRSERRKELLLAAESFQHKLQSYAAIVDLLESSADSGDGEALLQMLGWNYQQLKIGAHEADGGAVQFNHNRRTLLQLAWNTNPDVRHRSRLILSEFDPAALLAALTERVGGEDPVAPEDYRELATLLATFEGSRELRGDAEAYSRNRSVALAALFGALPAISLDQREIVYDKLLACLPGQLETALIRANARILREPEASALQHLRYLEHVRRLSDAGAGVDARVNRAVAAFVRYPSLAVKKQAAAALVGRDPVLLAQSCAAAIDWIGRESAACATYLADGYMDTLARLERLGRRDALQKTMAPRDPHAVLAKAMARPEVSIQAKITAFLRTRDPNLLVTMLAKDLARRLSVGAAVDSRQWCLLGDVTEAVSEQLNGEAVAAAVAALRRGLSAPDREQAMLCARYLLELGQSPATIAGNTPDIRVMAAMAQGPPDTPDDQ